jgi:hypothetical protein
MKKTIEYKTKGVKNAIKAGFLPMSIPASRYSFF